MSDPLWQRWLTPERPGLRQFALVALAFILPVPAVVFSLEMVFQAMTVGVVLGVGLGLGWTLVQARTWWRTAPTTTIAVLAIAYGCLLHVQLLPRWELLLRLRDTRTGLIRFGLELSSQTVAQPPIYRRGESSDHLARGQGTVTAYTPRPLQRWSLFGWRDNAWLVLGQDGTIETLWSAEEFERRLSPPLLATP